jgi:hypothetical protein
MNFTSNPSAPPGARSRPGEGGLVGLHRRRDSPWRKRSRSSPRRRSLCQVARLKPATATVPTATAKEQDKEEDYKERLGIHDCDPSSVSTQLPPTGPACALLLKAKHPTVVAQTRKLLKEDFSRRCNSRRKLAIVSWGTSRSRVFTWPFDAGVEPHVGSVGESYDHGLSETATGTTKLRLIKRRSHRRCKRSRIPNTSTRMPKSSSALADGGNPIADSTVNVRGAEGI